jgi:hypothetical protein
LRQFAPNRSLRLGEEIYVRPPIVRLAVLVLTLGVARTAPIAAQLCIGRVASPTTLAHVGARYVSYPASQREYGLEVGLASTSGLFGSGAIALTTVSDPNGTAKSGEIWMGAAVSTNDPRIVVCPLTGLQYTVLPTPNVVGVRRTGHSFAYSLGVSIGAPFPASSALQVVPFAGAYFQLQQFNYTSDALFSDNVAIDNFHNGLYETGLAIVAGRRLSIGPVMRNVFATERSGRPAYGVVMSFGFGG